jgi:hypothetical protein
MKHLSFYYAIGFLVVGCIMLSAGFPTLLGTPSYGGDFAGTAVLGLAMVLPFLIAGVSWRDWLKLKKEN